ncbi:hypothetical protein CQW23_14608 [Capsicum baccatum]|uniref:LRR receptor-like serine/threonine-protein kinase n=1 Tax=Capsicum baccatum TaxID=33114 RepID=A0A2G2WJX6_CAPBA|nr:hypothetical protein CQW23_14608 [Capsicum baccatum]
MCFGRVWVRGIDQNDLGSFGIELACKIVLDPRQFFMTRCSRRDATRSRRLTASHGTCHNFLLDYQIFAKLVSLERDLSENLLQGEIPQNLYNLSNLVYLDLHHHQLNGNIPSTIENLSNLYFLDLSQNTLSGSILVALEDLQNLTHFNLSYNLLSGAIPSIESIQKFGPSAFFHNTDLCGDPLEVSCSAGGTTFAKRKPKLSVSTIVAIIAAAVILSDYRRRREDEAFIVESMSLASTDSMSL